MRYFQQRVMCCGTCKIEIASQKDVFVMSKDGIQSNYCNPGKKRAMDLTDESIFSL